MENESNKTKTIKKIIKQIIGKSKSKAIFPDSKKIISDLIRDSLDIFFPKLQITDNEINVYVENILIKPKEKQSITSIIQDIVNEYNDLSQLTIPKFNHNDIRDQFYRKICNQIKIDSQYIKFWNQYQAIENVPQPEQKSQAWFDMRNNFITASAGAQAIGESKYEKPIELIKQKIGLGKPFGENFNVHHGKKFEKIAILIYENIYNNKVGEFGLVPHMGSKEQEVVPFLGASPDGICTCTTLDGKFSPMVGRMLEIKCVTSRIINTEGDEDGVITPHYYWVQVQLQLECCNLEECDFWQCKLEDGVIKKYKVGEEWTARSMPWTYQQWKNIIEDEENETVHTEQQNKPIYVDPSYKYGTMIELLPIKKDDLLDHHRIEWYGKYIYPTELAVSMKDKVEWAEWMRCNWKEVYPEFATDYKFGRVLYWNLSKSHCYLIKRNREWFKEKYPKFKEFWDQVLELRNDPIKKQQLIDKIAKEESDKLVKQEKRSIMNKIKLENMNVNVNVKATENMFDSD